MSAAEKLKYELELALRKFIEEEDLIQLVAKEVPRKWERHGDLVLFPSHAFRSELWLNLGDSLFEIVCELLKVSKVARKSSISPDEFRTPRVQLLHGESAWVTHKDNGIKYSWDVTKCMFSAGNITEKLRIAKFNCTEEVVVDLFAGIGYFTLVYLVHANAKHLHACEWNPDAVEALKLNLKQNRVDDRCTVHQGDNRETCPDDVADRVNLGLIPSSEISWKTACHALKSTTGGVLHVHANIKSQPGSPMTRDAYFKYPEWRDWTDKTIQTFQNLFLSVKHKNWTVNMIHLEHVKSYAPHVDHVVLDLDCRPSIT